MGPLKKFICIVAVLGLAACGEDDVVTKGGTDITDQAFLQKGARLYLEFCADCHGQKLEGEAKDWRTPKEDGKLPAPPHDETGHTWHHSDQLLFDYTKHGGAAIAPKGFNSGMPPFKQLMSDDDIWAVLSYIKSKWPEEVQRRQAGLGK